MDEKTIAARLAQNVPREARTIEQTPVPESTYEASEVDEGYTFDNPLDEISMHKLFDYFNVPFTERATADTNSMMTKLVEWAVGRGAVEYFDVIAQIRDAQQITKATSLADVYRFTKLDTQSRAIDAEMRALYG